MTAPVSRNATVNKCTIWCLDWNSVVVLVNVSDSTGFFSLHRQILLPFAAME